VFLAKLVVDSGPWREGVGRRVWALCIGGGAYSSVGTLVVSVLVGTQGPEWARFWLLGNALLFLLLGGAFLWLALLVRRRPDAEYARMLLKKTSLSNVTAAVTLVFTTRCLYDFLAFSGAITLDLNKDDFVTDASAAVMFGVWEFFPLMLLLSTLAAGPASGVSMRGVSESRTPMRPISVRAPVAVTTREAAVKPGAAFDSTRTNASAALRALGSAAAAATACAGPLSSR
jgi:hypothetical protein